VRSAPKINDKRRKNEMRDLHNNIDVRVAIDPYDHGSGDAAKTTEILDRQGYGSVELVLQFGSIADTDATFTVALAESSDSGMSGGSAVGDTDLLGTELLATPLFSDDNKVYKLGYIGNYRYIQGTIPPADNTGAILMSAVWVLGHPDNAPTPNPPSN